MDLFPSFTRAIHRHVPSYALLLWAAATTAAAQDPPVISDQPPGSVAAGSTYRFQPTVTNPSGEPLSFGIRNKPSWATFNLVTGLLTGTPSSVEAGTYGPISIYATDGQGWGWTSPFNITVEPASGTATLYWTDPTESANGTTLNDLAGYHLYYGKSPSELSTVVQLPEASVTTYTIRNLGIATWYFGIRAYTSSGLESPMSEIVSKIVN